MRPYSPWACARQGELRFASTGMPDDFSCDDTAFAAGEVFTRVDYGEKRALVAAYPLSAPADDVRLVILHDYADVEERREQARLFIVLAAIGIAFGGAALASLVAFSIMRRWTMSVRRAIEDAREGRTEDMKHTPTEIGSEIRQALSELDFARRTIDTVHTEWNPETLRIALANELPGSEVIVVSNREPYIHNLDENGEMKVQRPRFRPRLGAGARHPRLRRHLDRAWFGQRRPRGGGQPRPGDGAALEPLLRPAPDLALGRGAGRLLLRLRQ